MHYMGMAAFEIAGIVVWDPVLVAASIVLGAMIGAIALPVGLHGDSERWKIGGALLLTLAICSHHFTAMGAVSIIPDPSIDDFADRPAGRVACDRSDDCKSRHPRIGDRRRRDRYQRSPPLGA